MGKGGFEHFYDWSFKNGWNPLLTIDRIDPNGNYCPQNCRWINWTEQQNNRRNNRYVEFNGETHTVAEWERILGWKSNTIYSRLDRGVEYRKGAYRSSKEKKFKIRCLISNANTNEARNH